MFPLLKSETIILSPITSIPEGCSKPVSATTCQVAPVTLAYSAKVSYRGYVGVPPTVPELTSNLKTRPFPTSAM